MEEHDISPQPAREAPPRDDGREALARALDDLQASKLRLERDAQVELEAGKQELVARLFPILDNLDRALAAGEGDAGRALVQGVALVREQLAELLNEYGLERLDPEGQPFDPRRHEALAVVPVERPELDARVVSVFEPGYQAGDRLLRPARVYVGRYRPGVRGIPIRS